MTVFYGKKGKATDYLFSLLPLILASAAFLGVRGLVLTAPAGFAVDDILTDPFALASASQRFATIFYNVGAYLRLLVFPHPLTIDYHPFHMKLMGWGSATVWLASLGSMAVVVYAAYGLRKRSIFAYGILFFLATFSVVSNLPFSTGTFMSERFLSSRWLCGALPSPRYVQAIVMALTLACAVKTLARNTVWKDDFTLLTTDARTSENSIKANMAAAVTYLMEASKPDRESLSAEYRARALEHAKKAVSAYEQNVEPARRTASSYTNALMLLGNAYSENGLLEEALACYRKLMGTAINRTLLYPMIQAAINKSNDVDFRVRSTSEFATLAPDSFTFNYHLGLLYGKDKNDLPMAINYFKKAVDLDPNDANALRGLGHAYSLAHEFGQAALCFQKLSDRNPDDPSLLRSLLDLYRRSGDAAKQDEIAKRLQTLGE